MTPLANMEAFLGCLTPDRFDATGRLDSSDAPILMALARNLAPPKAAMRGSAPSERLSALVAELHEMEQRGLFNACHRDVRFDLRAIVVGLAAEAERVADGEEENRPMNARELPRFDDTKLRMRAPLRLVTPIPVHVFGRAAE